MASEKEVNGITLHDVLTSILKGWKLLLCIIVIVIAIGSIYTFKIKKNTYYSTGSITVEYKGEESRDFVDLNSSLKYVTTVAETMKLDEFLTRVSNRLPEYNLGVESLNKMVKLTYSSNSMLISFKATTESGVESQAIVRTIADEISKYSSTSDSDYEKLYCKISVRDNGTNYYKAGPNRTLYLVVTILIAFILGALVVFVKEFCTFKFRNKDEIENLGYPIIGVKYNIKKRNDDDKSDLVTPDFKSLEPYNRLLTNIQLSNVDKTNKVVMVTSTGPAEFKTTVISNVALAAVKNGKTAIIIDLDLRKPRIHKVFGLSKNDGLVEYCNDEITLDNLIKKTSSKVDVITAGKKTDIPYVILESEKLKNLINTLKEKYDYVFIDTAPTIVSNDALLAAKLCDGCIFNVGIKKSHKKDIRDSINSVGKYTNIIGITCTNVTQSRFDNYYYYNYNYSNN